MACLLNGFLRCSMCCTHRDLSWPFCWLFVGYHGTGIEVETMHTLVNAVKVNSERVCVRACMRECVRVCFVLLQTCGRVTHSGSIMCRRRTGGSGTTRVRLQCSSTAQSPSGKGRHDGHTLHDPPRGCRDAEYIE